MRSYHCRVLNLTLARVALTSIIEHPHLPSATRNRMLPIPARWQGDGPRTRPQVATLHNQTHYTSHTISAPRGGVSGWIKAARCHICLLPPSRHQLRNSMPFPKIFGARQKDRPGKKGDGNNRPGSSGDTKKNDPALLDPQSHLEVGPSKSTSTSRRGKSHGMYSGWRIQF